MHDQTHDDNLKLISVVCEDLTLFYSVRSIMSPLFLPSDLDMNTVLSVFCDTDLFTIKSGEHSVVTTQTDREVIDRSDIRESSLKVSEFIFIESRDSSILNYSVSRTCKIHLEFIMKWILDLFLRSSSETDAYHKYFLRRRNFKDHIVKRKLTSLITVQYSHVKISNVLTLNGYVLI